MTRQVILVFFGKARWGESAEAELANLQAHGVGAGATQLAAGGTDDPHDADGPLLVDDIEHAKSVHPHESVVDDDRPAGRAGRSSPPSPACSTCPSPRARSSSNRWLEPVIGQYQAHLDGEHPPAHRGADHLDHRGLHRHRPGLRRVREAPVAGQEDRAAVPVPRLVHRPRRHASSWAARAASSSTLVALFDRVVIDGAVNGVGKLTRGGAVRLRRVQSGYVRGYALMIGLGAVLLIAFVLTQVSFT